jgi:osmotically-inducible protein OsmY
MSHASIDDRIRADIVEALRCESSLDPAEIEVAVDGRVATLSGRVHDAGRRDLAERTTRRVPGLKSVVNHLHTFCGSSDSHADSGLIQAVTEAFGPGHRRHD